MKYLKKEQMGSGPVRATQEQLTGNLSPVLLVLDVRDVSPLSLLPSVPLVPLVRPFGPAGTGEARRPPVQAVPLVVMVPR